MNNFVPSQDSIPIENTKTGNKNTTLVRESLYRKTGTSKLHGAAETTAKASPDLPSNLRQREIVINICKDNLLRHNRNHNSSINTMVGQASCEISMMTGTEIAMDLLGRENFKEESKGDGPASPDYYSKLNFNDSERSRTISIDSRDIEHQRPPLSTSVQDKKGHQLISSQSFKIDDHDSFQFSDSGGTPAQHGCGLDKDPSNVSMYFHTPHLDDDLDQSISSGDLSNALSKPRSNVESTISSESRKVQKWRQCVFLFIFFVGIFGSISIGWFVHGVSMEISYLEASQPDEDFESFLESARVVESLTNEQIMNTALGLQQISRAISAEANTSFLDDQHDNNWTRSENLYQEGSSAFPFVTLPSFQDSASQLMNKHVHVDRVFWAPIVDKSHKVKWENYSTRHQGWIMRESGASSTAFTEMVIPPLVHSSPSIGNHYNELSFESLPVWQIVDADYLKDEAEMYTGDPSIVNFDLFSSFSHELGSVSFEISNSDGWVSDVRIYSHELTIYENIPSIILQVPIFENHMSKTVTGYVFAVLKRESGLLSNGVTSTSNSELERHGYVLVVQDELYNNLASSIRTYEVRNELASNAIGESFLGYGDLHDSEYDDWGYDFALGSSDFSLDSSTKLTLYPTREYVESITVNEVVNSTTPMALAILTSIVVAIVFGIMLLLLRCYDRSVEDRQEKLLRQAERTDAIVGSMFPANIQKKLMDLDNSSHDKNKGSEDFKVESKPNIGDTPFPTMMKEKAKGSNRSGGGKAGFLRKPAMSSQAGTRRRRFSNARSNSDRDINADCAYVPSRLVLPPPPPQPAFSESGNEESNHDDDSTVNLPSIIPRYSSLPTVPSAPPSAKDGIDSLLNRFGKSKPMADFYPNTTIMMCDIAGFTAWSSARSPADVFRLLETIYGAFDDIARQSKVFKVETVGDCYVACAGLPVRQPKHAIIMARFAKKCLRRYELLIKKLEVYLGPDTVDLGLRMGIHSGPTTAGVLRGDKTRFQLFGDTVNTASRMESTGEVNKIQITGATAKLLSDEGYSSWYVKRENLVAVKGKGEMQTYWLRRSFGKSRSKSPKNDKPRQTKMMWTRNSFRKNNGSITSQSAIESLDGDDTTLQDSSIRKSPSNASFQSLSNLDATSVEFSPQESPAPSIRRRKSWTPEDNARNPKEHRLIEWVVETLMQSLKKIAIDRKLMRRRLHPIPQDDNDVSIAPLLHPNGDIVEEVKEFISIRQIPSNVLTTIRGEDDDIEISHEVEDQLRDYVTVISLLYHDHAFHNFEHCAHVLMSVTKLFNRILEGKKANGRSKDNQQTYGLTADPLIEFACLFSALIHDVDHSGVPNAQLVKENTATASHYKNRSVAEQHSVEVAWSHLMEPAYKDLRKCIFETSDELQRFRQLVVHSVMATDIIDSDLKKFREARWEKAFSQGKGPQLTEWGKSTEDANRMATVVIEHLIQASDICHTMQHWHIYLKFNERLFQETYKAYMDGRGEKDPSTYWYEGELGFFQFYIIPLASKLNQCGVFGVSSDECLMHAESNRSEWEQKGKEIVQGYMERIKATE